MAKSSIAVTLIVWIGRLILWKAPRSLPPRAGLTWITILTAPLCFVMRLIPRPPSPILQRLTSLPASLYRTPGRLGYGPILICRVYGVLWSRVPPAVPAHPPEPEKTPPAASALVPTHHRATNALASVASAR